MGAAVLELSTLPAAHCEGWEAGPPQPGNEAYQSTRSVCIHRAPTAFLLPGSRTHTHPEDSSKRLGKVRIMTSISKQIEKLTIEDTEIIPIKEEN